METREKVARWLRAFVMKINRDSGDPDTWNDAIAKIWLPEADELLALVKPSPESQGGLSDVPVEFEKEAEDGDS